jgi:hypothetical protein
MRHTQPAEKDIVLCDRLSASGHWSPFEHIAHPRTDLLTSGNFVGWDRYRKVFASEKWWRLMNGDNKETEPEFSYLAQT